MCIVSLFFFFFQAEDGIRDYKVTGVQTCALPISPSPAIVQIGGRTIPAQPLEMVRGMVAGGKEDAFVEAGERGAGSGPIWSREAQERLARVPNFVRGMVKKIYADYARERGIAEVTTAVMDAARAELGLEGM